MKRRPVVPLLTLAALAASACAPGGARQAPPPASGQPAPTVESSVAAPTDFEVPVEYYKLANGLKVVLSRDDAAPKAVVGVYYNIGFRNEPRDRTGFAHLFEHLMFQGSENLGKGEFFNLVQSNGGVLNGSTRFDFTNYFEIVPSHTLETVLWAEADRMRGLDITQENLENQQGVVTNEVLVSVINQPYGGFPWLDLPQHANTNWHNAHNFYGELDDLQAATLEDARSFFDTYYAPNNAALVVVGDFEEARTRQWIEQYFGDIPAVPQPPVPDISEPRQTEEKRVSRSDPKATRPALAIGYHAPPRNTPEYFAFGILNEILVQGRDSRLYRSVVQERGLSGDVSGGVNLLGNMFNINGPTLLTLALFHDEGVSADSIIEVIDQSIEPLRTTALSQADLERALVQVRSALYDEIDSTFGFGRADLLASLALFDDDPGRINRLETEYRRVTPELVLRTAQEYLRPTNRTILTIEPGATAGEEEEE
jgi:zinc protease